MDGKSDRTDTPPASVASRSVHVKRRNDRRARQAETLEELVRQVEELRLKLGLTPSQEVVDGTR